MIVLLGTFCSGRRRVARQGTVVGLMVAHLLHSPQDAIMDVRKVQNLLQGLGGRHDAVAFLLPVSTAFTFLVAVLILIISSAEHQLHRHPAAPAKRRRTALRRRLMK